MKEISLHVLDLANNALEAGATHLEVMVDVQHGSDTVSVSIADNGCGMDDESARKAQDPFVTSRTTRKVGLGIPLFRAGCLGCGGTFRLESEPGRGTRVMGSWKLSHIDRPPIGDMAATALLLILDPRIDLEFRASMDEGMFALSTADLRKELGDTPLHDPEVVGWIASYIRESLEALYGGEAL